MRLIMVYSFMSRPKIIHDGLVKKAQEAVCRTRDMEEYREAQAVLFPAIMGATLEQTAVMLGVGRATVHRLQTRFRKRQEPGEPVKRGWGGRRRSLMTPEEEKKFLLPWEEKAGSGGILVVSVIRAALAQKLGKQIKPSVVYRLLGRHGWRKVAPDTHHPKSSPETQEVWKKNFRKHWQPC
jgi:transposase